MTAAKPAIECDQLHPGIEVSDLTAALDFYVNKLGFVQAFIWGEPPTFAGVNLGHVQIFLQQGTPTPSANTAASSFLVDDVDALYDLKTLVGLSVYGGPVSDAVLMSQIIPLPPAVWAVLWCGLALAILGAALRPYWRDATKAGGPSARPHHV